MSIPGNAYWAEAGKLLAGPLPAHPEHEKLRAIVRGLIDAGVRTVIDLRTPAEPPSIRALLSKLATAEEEVTWLGVPILDGTAPNVATAQLVLDTIDAQHARSRCVYVHCAGGRGRTGTLVACWWIRHAIFSPEEALDELRARRVSLPQGHLPSPETGPQIRLVRSWRTGL